MTLIVYKDGILAADTRATHRCGAQHETNCAHCGKGATAVNDNKQKITLLSQRKTSVMFRGEKVNAVASSGSVHLINRIQRIITSGKDLEAVYENYLSVFGANEEQNGSSTTVLICETHNYVVQAPRKGELEVEQIEKDKFITIGSGTDGAVWVKTLHPHLSAPSIINVVMHKSVGVGGEIDFIDFSKPELSIERQPKYDPKSIINGLIEVFQRGKEAMVAEQKKKPRTRKTTTNNKETK